MQVATLAEMHKTYSLLAIKANRGECFNRIGKLDQALAEFNEALVLNPSSGLALLNRAEVDDKQKRHDLAAKDKEKAAAMGCQHP